jgi:hypothetical protein
MDGGGAIPIRRLPPAAFARSPVPMNRNHVRALLLGLVGTAFLAAGAIEVGRGYVRVGPRGGAARVMTRAENPGFFWSHAALMVLLALAAFAFAGVSLRRAGPRPAP